MIVGVLVRYGSGTGQVRDRYGGAGNCQHEHDITLMSRCPELGGECLPEGLPALPEGLPALPKPTWGPKFESPP